MIDIIIVNWNSGNLLKECIDSILQSNQTQIIGSIFIIDNASKDLSISHLPINEKIVLIQNNSNKGFSAACNQGFKLCTSPFILLLNPDAKLFSTTLSQALECIQNKKDIGILGVQLIKPDGKIGVSCARFPTPMHILFDATGLSLIAPKCFTPSTLMTDWDHNTSAYVNQVSGAFMLIRKEVFNQIGYFDEQFFVYYEELDFSKRFIDYGGNIFFNANIKAIHEENGTTNNIKAFRLFLNLRSRLQYAKKHFSIYGYLITFFITWFIESFSRMFLSLIKGNFEGVKEVFKAYTLLFRNKIHQS